MLDRLKSMFRSDDFIPSSAVFPSIDSDKIAKDLKLEDQGTARGQNNQPPSDTKDFDHVETSVIERIEELRRKGLENYESNRRVYNERLARAGQASKEVDIAAGSAKNDFGALVQEWQSRIEDPRERLNETFTWRARYRERNRLQRPAKEFEGWIKVFSLTIILVVIEAGINSYLFSKGNEFGLLGGLLAALIVSVVNVGGSAMLGYLARYLHHCNLLLKLGGLIFVLVWMAFAVAMNLGVAHFRDGLESGLSWAEATEGAVPALLARPLYLASIESWLLVGIGLLISVLSFRKGWHTDDPYPGYGRLERSLTKARSVYELELHNALEDLKDRRDQAIEELQDASEQVRNGITEAIDALFGQSTLGAHLKTYLEQCDVKTAHLLAVYRDANRAARKDPSPKSFDRVYKFGAFKPESIEVSRRENAEAEASRVTATVDGAINEIFEQFETARLAFDVTRAVQRDGVSAEKV
ncbi:MAG: rane protein [Cypionkella sp.]|uniref:hypothetical protein n=1 Tax=Cypionkella sp. TaxID=2811411 RepID=UPI00262688A6|nr:hypothetical protein [Cypionkella sp.]MDB5658478.1 rane protein [Cypionkella sp.]